jgi:hypothetical protein
MPEEVLDRINKIYGIIGKKEEDVQRDFSAVASGT